MARDLLSTGGIASLTMRSLASRCCLSVNTVYAAVGDKEQILQAVMNTLLSEIPLPNVDAEYCEDELLHYFEGIRSLFDQNPAVRELIAIEPIYGESVIAGLDHLVSLLLRCGLTSATAALACHTLIAYTIGFSVHSLPRTRKESLRHAATGSTLDRAI
ncbi:hypothetical protein AXA44_45430 [Rhodococcus sp. SC4]|nr:hypothetical protein AXA44_45430 [Rhodococcus sp. SC4]